MTAAEDWKPVLASVRNSEDESGDAAIVDAFVAKGLDKPECCAGLTRYDVDDAGKDVVAERSSNCINQIVAKAVIFLEESSPYAHCKIWDMPNNCLVQEVKRSYIE